MVFVKDALSYRIFATVNSIISINISKDIN